jgi:hypothetical protein
MDSPPILTIVNSSFLECTVRSSKYHCLLKLRSNTCTASNDGETPITTTTTTAWATDATKTKPDGRTTTMAVPDISSLAAIPILSSAERTYAKRRRPSTSTEYEFEYDDDDDDEIFRIHLLPKLFHSSRRRPRDDEKSTTADEFTPDDDRIGDGSRDDNHPIRELVRIAADLEVQLRERLGDASEGAIAAVLQTRDERDSNDPPDHAPPDDRCSTTAAGIHEEFLLRCEAIMLELSSTVQQHVRREQSRHGKKVAASSGKPSAPPTKSSSSTFISSSSSMIPTTPPPLKYYSALARQLHVLESMPNVKEISIHDRLQPTAVIENSDLPPQDLTSISITCHDENKRGHMWHAELFPSVVLTVDLPVEFVLEDNHNRPIRLERWWEDDLPEIDPSLYGRAVSSASIEKMTLLPRIQNCFETALQRYQPLFNELDDLDTHFWILEPSLPARRSNVERRIALWVGGASLVIALDPDNPRGIPVMVRFLGVTLATMKAAAASGCGQGITRAERTTTGDIVDWRTSFSDFVSEEEDGGVTIDGKMNSQSKANTVLDQNRSDNQHESTTTSKVRWSKERSIRENLELWFGSPLPSPLSSSVTEKSDFLVECAVCYTHRLPTEDSNCGDGPLPEVKCSNPSCSRHYHESCLFEWLHSLPTARVSFDRIFGSCMYCSQGISVKILNGQV